MYRCSSPDFSACAPPCPDACGVAPLDESCGLTCGAADIVDAAAPSDACAPADVAACAALGAACACFGFCPASTFSLCMDLICAPRLPGSGMPLVSHVDTTSKVLCSCS